MDWPKRGVYFFRELGENRSDTGEGPRIVRVGTHALKSGSQTKLWTRLSQHKGQPSTGRGNHRGSIFRLIVGTALIKRDAHDFPCDEPMTFSMILSGCSAELAAACGVAIAQPNIPGFDSSLGRNRKIFFVRAHRREN
jgi:hypothetical protein